MERTVIGLAAEEAKLLPTQKLIPADGAPDEFKPLIDVGKVTVAYESAPDFVKANRGWADFLLHEKHSFRYSASKSTKRGQSWMNVHVTKLDVEITVTHLVRLPSAFERPNIWTNRILRHEFDHVAIGCDPRPKLLLKRLLHLLPKLEVPFKGTEPPSEATIDKAIEEAIHQRLSAVREVIQQNNTTLDDISRHGVIPVPRREAFFKNLYSKENLAELKFPYLNDVVKLLNSESYDNEPHYHLHVDP